VGWWGTIGKDSAGEKDMVYGHCEEPYGGRLQKEGWAERGRWECW